MEGMQKLKNKKMTSTGISEEVLIVNDVGNSYLHLRHKVEVRSIDNTKVGRAIVFDQHIIDKLYTEQLINEKQHNVCDKYLGLISRSGVFPQSSAGDLDKIFTSNSSPSVNTKPLVLSQVQNRLVEDCGSKKEKEFWKVMTENPDRITQSQLDSVIDCSDAMLNFWYLSQTSPISLFQKAFLNLTE